MQKMNFDASYSKRYSESGDKWYYQNGLEYDLKGNALDKKLVKKKVEQVAEAAQKEANTAMENAKRLQDQADAAQELLEGPDAPKTVQKLKEALDDMEINYPSKASKAILEQLWVDAQAA